jgi:hypothetical protein
LWLTQNWITIETSEGVVIRIRAMGSFGAYSRFQIAFRAWKCGDKGV